MKIAMKKMTFYFFLVIILSITTSCSDKTSNKTKYVFLFIGDGMGIQQVNAAQVYTDSVLKDSNDISFTKFPIKNFVTTYAANRYITCSAAAGTALSTGQKTSIGTLGLDASRKDTLFSIAKTFKEHQYRVGLVTSVSIDHATPAAFYAHQPERGGYYPIALDLLKSGYDFFASGGFVDPYGKKEKNPVQSIYQLGRATGVAFTSNTDSIPILKETYKSVVYSAPNPAPSSTLQYQIDRKGTDKTLAELTGMAINMLDNPKGFFLMVEGGKIDWACHSNDAATTIYEVIAFSDAIKKAVDFYHKHPNETIIIVTADHETGGFSLGNTENKYDIHLRNLAGQKISKEQFQLLIKTFVSQKPVPSFKDILKVIENNSGLGSPNLQLSNNELAEIKDAYQQTFGLKKLTLNASKSEYAKYNDVLSDKVISLLNNKAGIGWTSTSHTGSPVPIYVLGQGQNMFIGHLDNTDIPKIISAVTF